MTHGHHLNLLNFFPRAYSVRRMLGGTDDKGKAKSTYAAVRQAPATELLIGHWEGKHAVSVQCILESGNTCQWGALDIDSYDDPKLVERVRRAAELFKLPCYIEASKSGGAHVYFFLDQPTIAKPFRRALQKLAVWMGFPRAEIRPAQDEVDFAKGDLGNFMVLPGFGIGAEKMRSIIQANTVSVKDFNDITDEGDFGDGPACLFPLQRLGEANGFNNRNLFLYQLAVYFRYKFPAEWADRVRSYNENIIVPSLPFNEVNALIGQLEKNAKCHYRCSGEPFEDVCNKTACQFRKFGVAARESANSLISPEGITVLGTDPPVYFATLVNPVSGESIRVKLNTDQLLNVNQFKKRCLETLNAIPSLPKQADWEAVVSKLMASAQLIPVPFEQTEEARVLDAIYRYCLTSVKSSRADDLLRGKVWLEQGADQGLVAHFRQVDFINYLSTHRVGTTKSQEAHATLNELCRLGHLLTEQIDLGGVQVLVYKTIIHSRYLELQTIIEQEKEAG
ncbi:MAG TPA: hypothetical protein VN081_03850 [Dongiaceae bacterium]|nr:hypothetical protein [Dongiaceae bacterium]